MKKDLLLEIRDLDHLVSIFLFGFLLLILFSFALSVEAELMQRMAPGLFWLAILFAVVLTVERSFQREIEDGQWDGLLMTGIDSKALYLGKLLAHWGLVICLQIALLPLMAVLFDIHLSASLVSVVALGSLGMVTLGTTFGGLMVRLKGGQVLLPLLLFPMLVPVLLAAVRVTQLTLAHDLFGQRLVWFELLILFDTVFVLGSLLGAETLCERF